MDPDMYQMAKQQALIARHHKKYKDPLLSKGDVRKLAEMLKSSGISKISGHLYLDVSMKDDLQYGWGWCWDDDYGPLSALTVDGKDEFSIHWVGALRNMGIGLSNKGVSFQICPSTANSIGKIIHSMDQILVPMMKDSENIFAESMFYQLATRSGQKSAGRKQAVPLVEALISHMGLQPERYCIADGSGLSLYNYASPILLATFLKHAYLNEPIRTHLYPSLPIAGIDGTLEKRMKESAADRIHCRARGRCCCVRAFLRPLPASGLSVHWGVPFRFHQTRKFVWDLCQRH